MAIGSQETDLAQQESCPRRYSFRDMHGLEWWRIRSGVGEKTLGHSGFALAVKWIQVQILAALPSQLCGLQQMV